MVSGCVSDLMHRAQDIVEQALMPAFLDEGAQRAGGERRQIDRLQLRGDAAADEGHQARSFRRRDRFRQQPQREAREIVAALAVAQPVGDEGAEIDLAQLGFDRGGFEKMHLDEFAELVGDAVLVALDDRGVRDRQSQRPAKQRHHGIPVGEAADGGGFGKGRDEAERRMQRQQRLGGHEQRQRRRQHQRRQRLDAPQLGGAGASPGVSKDEGGGNGHDGFRRVEDLDHCTTRYAVIRGARVSHALEGSHRPFMASRRAARRALRHHEGQA